MPETAETIRIPSGGLQLYGRLWHLSGEAPTILLLCGLGFHTFEYEPLGAALAAAGLNALAFDFRGHGHSGGPRGRWTLHELTADTRAALDVAASRSSGPMVLFGNSLGGMVAMLAAAVDERADGVVAANCPAHAADILLTPARRVLYALLKLVEPVAPLRISVNHYIRYEQLTGDSALIARIRCDRLITDARRLSVRTYQDLLEVWDGPDAARALHTPLLVLQGRHDGLQPAQQSELIFAAASEPKQYRLLDTGHLPHLDAPARLADLLIGWTATLGRPVR